ncbi:MAG TPA: hypothetical protein VMF31_01100 [Solirubrobacterales bacterium]|nr:hypothetical protein [Solirubrobacterales bacterium]
MSFSRVRAGEWIASLCGALILVALFMPWYGDESALAQLSLLDLILLAVAVVAVALPLVLARSRTTNVPIVTETFISTMAVIAAILLLIRLIWAPDGGLRSGFYLSLAGSVLLSIVGWKNTSRES